MDAEFTNSTCLPKEDAMESVLTMLMDFLGVTQPECWTAHQTKTNKISNV